MKFNSASKFLLVSQFNSLENQNRRFVFMIESSKNLLKINTFYLALNAINKLKLQCDQNKIY